MEVWIDHFIQLVTPLALIALGISWYRFYVKGQTGWQSFKSACKQVWPATVFLGFGLISVIYLFIYLLTS
jgi:hypothetical protein